MDIEDMKDPIEICLYILDVTERAIRVCETEFLDFRNAQWVPLSQIYSDDSLERRKTVTITIPEWLAIEKGLV